MRRATTDELPIERFAFPWDEYRKASKGGRSSAKRFIRRCLTKALNESDPPPSYDELYTLLEYTKFIEVHKMDRSAYSWFRRILSRMDSLVPTAAFLPYYIANSLFFTFNKPRLALLYIDRAKQLAVASGDLSELHYVVLSLRLEVAVLSKHYPSSNRLRKAIWDLGYLLWPSTFKEAFPEVTLSRLAEIRPPLPFVDLILQHDWGHSVAVQRFRGHDTSKFQLQIEQLMAGLPEDEDNENEDEDGADSDMDEVDTNV